MRYRSAELDALIDRFYATVSKAERNQALGQIIHHVTDQVIPIGIFYNTQPVMIGNRFQNVTTGGANRGPGWNVHEWDVR